MTSGGPTSPALPPSAANGLPGRQLFALLLGRDVVPAADSKDPGPGGGTLLPLPLQLFVLSFLMLFVELALIRWSGALVIYLAGDQYAVNVNGIPHQNIIPARKLQKIYSLPYQHAPGDPLNNVLIIGAGTGDDVANALLKGARHIDAVEIDPEL